MADNDTLPPEVRAVIDAVERVMAHDGDSGIWQALVDLKAMKRAYDARRAPKELYAALWGIITDKPIPDYWCRVEKDGRTVAVHLDWGAARQHAAWLNAAERGELLTREECERRERAADHKARVDCAWIANRHGNMAEKHIRATIKDKP